MLAIIRFPIAFATGMFVLFTGIFIYRLFGRLLAGVCTLFLTIEPFLLSESSGTYRCIDCSVSLFDLTIMGLLFGR